MDEKYVSYLAFESVTARQERTIKRLWILTFILIVALLGTNAGWIYYESQWEVMENKTEITQELDTSGGGDAIINDGVHYNGESETDSKNNE